MTWHYILGASLVVWAITACILIFTVTAEEEEKSKRDKTCEWCGKEVVDGRCENCGAVKEREE